MLFRQLSLTAKKTVRYTEQNEGCMIFMKSPVPNFMFFHCFIISQIIVILIQRVICLFSHAAKTFPDSPRSLLLISVDKNLKSQKFAPVQNIIHSGLEVNWSRYVGSEMGGVDRSNSSYCRTITFFLCPELQSTRTLSTSY